LRLLTTDERGKSGEKEISHLHLIKIAATKLRKG